MDPIGGMTGATAAGGTPRRPAAGGFRVPEAAPPPAAVATPAVLLDGLLALQEAGDTGAADRRARQRGRDLLAALAALQRDLLAGIAPRLEGLAALAAELPAAADPALRAVLAALVLRARVELARVELARVELARSRHG